jgi:hypothetical protein
MAYVQSSPLPTSTFNNGSSQLALNKSLLHKSRQHKSTMLDQKHVLEMHKKKGKDAVSLLIQLQYHDP